MEGSWIQGGGRNTAQVPGQLTSGSTSGTSGSQPGTTAVPGPLQHLPPGKKIFNSLINFVVLTLAVQLAGM